MSNVAGRGHQAGAPATNLPHYLTSFIGRAAELRSLRSLLTEARLVTILGTGGAGKSRLAAELAKATLDSWPDGAWWVELAAADDVAGAIMATLELPGRGPADSVVTSWLAARRALLVLDNCEQLVGACAAFSQAALARCPRLAIVATSREALGVPGEVRWPLSPLRDEDTLRLFEARARLVSPEFKVASSDIKSVTEICERLDRLPLAIEMAASRLDMMSERELLNNLNDRFRVLTSGTRGGPARQQTMAAAIDWSHRLLTENEARLFRRLAVFQGGFTLEGVQAVSGDDDAAAGAISVLGALVQKSMVVADRLDDGSTRYRLLESQHAYAADKLRESGELELVCALHHEYFMSCLDTETVSPGTRLTTKGLTAGVAEQKWLARESANLWAALAWARANAADMGLALALVVADSEYTDHARARSLLLDLLERTSGVDSVRARAFNLAARLASRQADHVNSRRLADSSVVLARQVGEADLLAQVLNGAGLVYHAAGELAVAGQMYAEALSQVTPSTNRRLVFELKNQQGLLAIEQGDFAVALDILKECVEFGRSEGDLASTARYLESYATAQLGSEDGDGAAASWKESLSAYRHLNDPFGTIWCIGGLALAAAARGDHERSLRLAAVVDRMSRESSLSTWSFRLNQLEEATLRTRNRMGARKSEAVWKEGQAMNGARALEYALEEERARPEEVGDPGPLSRREREVAAMVATGMTNRQIAERLFIAERTAEGHVERIRNKLGFRSRTEVATWAVERGLGPRKLDNPTPASTV
jgi:predicted ATPase/DNA-binding CsgD family transcriptional regulator